MKILTEKQYEELVISLTTKARNEGFKEGYEKGLNKGLIADKKGIHMNNSGIYVFEEGVSEEVKLR